MEIINLREQPEWTEQAAAWFHLKWEIAQEEYEKSIEESQKMQGTIPRWYLMAENREIIAGVGVIANDFHKRKDLTPNLCALYVEEKYRGRGIAGKLLRHVCGEMARLGTDTLYLVTDHTSFYERYGWEFFGMVEEEDGHLIRMYLHKQKKQEQSPGEY